MSGQEEELLRDFLIESAEAVDKLDEELVVLEQSPEDMDVLNSIFRGVHTIKGTCGFLELNKLQSISHVGETLLDDLRSGKLRVTEDIITVLLKLSDAIKEILNSLSAGNGEGDKDYGWLIKKLEDAAHAKTLSCAPSESTATQNQKSVEKEMDPLEAEFLRIVEERRAQESVEEDSVPSRQPESVIMDEQIEGPKNDESKSVYDLESSSSESKAESRSADTTIRVDVELLDRLMNLVGELVLARNQILQFTKNKADTSFNNASQRLNLITSELQESVMRTRMQPIATVWKKFPRIVRDLAKNLGKSIRLEMEGQETDLDKTIIEAIKDPLTHIVRNSVDHGIESMADRAANGKPEEGLLLLKAYHEGGHVIIEIVDDGGGLNTNRIRQKAVERGLMTQQQAKDLSDQEANYLIFMPGFSTAKEVTNISGRGVGMDVVRSNIEAIGGVVDLSSEFGKGTQIRIKIPLTLAIIPALLIEGCGERFAIPQVSLVELIRIDATKKNEIENIQGVMLYRLRGELLPLVDLNTILGLQQEQIEREAYNVVVIRSDEKQFGLIVDNIHDTEEIVVKPLGKILKDNPIVAGATILGDGHVALILDVSGLARFSSIVDSDSVQDSAQKKEVAEVSEKTTMVLVNLAEDRVVAIPLQSVHRLEQFSGDKIEYSSRKPVVQYGNNILNLVDLAAELGEDGVLESSRDKCSVVVVNQGGKYRGFLVHKIVDILEQDLQVADSQDYGVMGCSIINGKVIDIVDTQTFG